MYHLQLILIPKNTLGTYLYPSIFYAIDYCPSLVIIRCDRVLLSKNILSRQKVGTLSLFAYLLKYSDTI